MFDAPMHSGRPSGADVFRRLAAEGAVPPWETELASYAPALGAAVEHGLGAVLGRPDLDLRTRELVTICMLAALGGSEPQLEFHIGGALRAGATPAEVVEAISQVHLYAGFPRALSAMATVRKVFEAESVEHVHPAPRSVVHRFLACVVDDDVDGAVALLADDVRVAVADGAPTAASARSVRGSGAVRRLLGRLAAKGVAERVRTADMLHGGDVVYVPALIDHVPQADGGLRPVRLMVEFHVPHGRITECLAAAMPAGPAR